jgi:hypothetical protein
MADVGSAEGHSLTVWVIGVASVVVSACITWFVNILYMRDRFVSKSECAECKQNSKDRADRIEACLDEQGKQSIETFGLVKEMHGRMLGPEKFIERTRRRKEKRNVGI